MGELYKVIDTRDSSVELVVAESIDDAARRAGVMIDSWDEEYIDQYYEVVEAA